MDHQHLRHYYRNKNAIKRYLKNSAPLLHDYNLYLTWGLHFPYHLKYNVLRKLINVSDGVKFILYSIIESKLLRIKIHRIFVIGAKCQYFLSQYYHS